MVRPSKKAFLYLAGVGSVALLAVFWVATANSIEDAREMAGAKSAADLASRQLVVPVSPLLDPFPDPVFTGTGVSSSDRGEVNANVTRLRMLIPKDGIRPVYEPTFLTASDIILGRDDLVIGLTINGDSRAYPISVLQRREMVNDVVGGVPILATW